MTRLLRSRNAATLSIVRLALLALLNVSACGPSAGGGATPVAPPPPPPMFVLPAQPVTVANLNQQILGQWSASYPGGPFRVVIQNDPLLGGTNYIATLMDGGYGSFHPGSIVFKGTPDQVVPNLVVGTQKCPDPGYASPVDVSMTITVVDANNFTEDLIQKGACVGFPVRFTRVAAAASP
jgi:hypothetical protein